MRGRVARNTVLAGAWQASRVAAQAVWVILLARTLGVAGYGVLGGLAAFATALSSLTGLGAGMVMLRRVPSDPERFGYFWRQALQVTLASGCVLALSFVLLSTRSADHTDIFPLLCAIAVSELLCTPFIALCSLAFQAHEKLGWCVALPSFAAFIRLGLTCAFLLSGTHRDIAGYAPYHACAALMSAAVAGFAVHAVARPDRQPFRWKRAEFIEGLAFSMLSFTGSATTELDKSLALRFGGAGLAGIYSASYRFVSVLTMPVVSLVMAVQPRLFRGGMDNRSLLRHAVVAILAYSIAGVLLMQVLAVALPVLLGPGYESSVHTARMLALLVPLYGIRLLGTTQLTAQGRLNRRILVELTGLTVMLVLAAVLIPRHGIDGAITATLCSEALLGALAWTATWVR